MMKIVRSEERFNLKEDWLDARWHFSFGHYHDPANIHFGALRVFNDDRIAPNGGFPPHPHAEMEIVTYVLKGELEHRDSMGHTSVLKGGGVQRMSAGTGVRHSEFNASGESTLHLNQIWLFPAEKGLAPSYEECQWTEANRQGRLLPIVSNDRKPGTIHIHQDATFYVSQLKAGESVAHTIKSGRRLYLFVIEGAATVNGQALAGGDQARIQDESNLTIAATEQTELLLIDLA
jgi:hypothetical protein